MEGTDISHIPVPTHMQPLPTSNIPHQRGMCVTTDELTGTHHCHSEPIVYTRVYLGCCMFYAFRQKYAPLWLPLWPSGKESPPEYAEDTGELSSVLGLRRSLGGGNGNPIQYSCLENSMGREAWQAIVHGVAKSWTILSE